MRMTLLNMVFSSVSFGLSAGCGTRLPNGCAVATHSLGDWMESAEGDHSLPGGRSPHLEEADRGFREGERASEGRGSFERGTLNGDRKANRRGSHTVQRPYLMARVVKASSETRSVTYKAGRKMQRRTEAAMLSLGPSPRFL